MRLTLDRGTLEITDEVLTFTGKDGHADISVPLVPEVPAHDYIRAVGDTGALVIAGKVIQLPEEHAAQVIEALQRTPDGAADPFHLTDDDTGSASSE